MSLFCSDRHGNNPRDDDDEPTPSANEDRLDPDQLDRLRMLLMFGSPERARRIADLTLCAMRGDFDDDR
jgi:hypothetical protein